MVGRVVDLRVVQHDRFLVRADDRPEPVGVHEVSVIVVDGIRKRVMGYAIVLACMVKAEQVTEFMGHGLSQCRRIQET